MLFKKYYKVKKKVKNYIYDPLFTNKTNDVCMYVHICTNVCTRM